MKNSSENQTNLKNTKEIRKQIFTDFRNTLIRLDTFSDKELVEVSKSKNETVFSISSAKAILKERKGSKSLNGLRRKFGIETKKMKIEGQ